MGEYDRHEAAMHDALREDRDAKQSRTKIKRIKEAKGLLGLVGALRHANAFFKERGERLEDYIDLSLDLPVFGSGPKSTVGIFSWETMHGDLCILIPSDEPRMNGWEVIKCIDAN